MSEINITIPAGSSKRLLTKGKFCDKNIVVTAEGMDALEALCEWQVTTNSSSDAFITIINLHPSYYLRCDISSSQTGELIPIIVDPDDSITHLESGVSGAGEGFWIMNIRWTANDD